MAHGPHTCIVVPAILLGRQCNVKQARVWPMNQTLRCPSISSTPLSTFYTIKQQPYPYWMKRNFHKVPQRHPELFQTTSIVPTHPLLSQATNPQLSQSTTLVSGESKADQPAGDKVQRKGKKKGTHWTAFLPICLSSSSASSRSSNPCCSILWFDSQKKQVCATQRSPSNTCHGVKQKTLAFSALSIHSVSLSASSPNGMHGSHLTPGIPVARHECPICGRGWARATASQMHEGKTQKLHPIVGAIIYLFIY